MRFAQLQFQSHWSDLVVSMETHEEVGHRRRVSFGTKIQIETAIVDLINFSLSEICSVSFPLAATSLHY